MTDYDFSKYTMADICEDLFCFTDALWDSGELSDDEQAVLSELRARFRELCLEDEWEE